jgi:F-type H+-transporting ATPase subunit epsilon
MTGPVFHMKIITPLGVLQREMQYIRLKDSTGYFGLMKSHADFLTVLVPSLGYYTDRDGGEVFLAVNGGVLSVRKGEAVLAAREVYESRDAEELSRIIEESVREKAVSEKTFEGMLKSLEKSFVQRSIDLERGGA